MFRPNYPSLFVIFIIAFTLSGCGSAGSKSNESATKSAYQEYKDKYPKTRDERQLEKMGKIGGSGLFNMVFGSDDGNKAGPAKGVNGYLWTASLDSVYKVPLEKIEPAAGIIMTDWYTLPHSTGFRYKTNIYITSSQLAADSIKVAVFSQRRIGNNWVDRGVSEALSHEYQEKILYKARELKVAKK